MGRWDRLLGTKPIPLIDQLLTEVAKLVAKDLATWPLPIRDVDPAGVRSFAQVLDLESRPAAPVFVEAFRLTRWEIQREIEAIDEYIRNRRWTEVGLAVQDKQPILFVSRWLLEQFLSLRESTHSRISRGDLLDCLERTHRFYGQSVPPLPPAGEGTGEHGKHVNKI